MLSVKIYMSEDTDLCLELHL